MQDAQYWLNEFWSGLSLLDLLGGSLLGTLLGLVLGLLGWRWLHRRGWLQRRKRWHHWLLASYVVLLPLATAFFGLQLGFTAGAHRAPFKQLDHFQPHLQTLVEGWSEGFTDSLDDPRMRDALRSQGTVGDVADTVASAYLSEHPLPGLDRLGDGPLARGAGWVDAAGGQAAGRGPCCRAEPMLGSSRVARWVHRWPSGEQPSVGSALHRQERAGQWSAPTF
ncbi:hypothetical protein [uncultured Stenotrophomonas sp.]|uniref:hypothetical protein n=1 Tax=uncultured Stenotrophomonas sp. TaxID=165438 RepID=UPI0025FD790B|nr:hypothetical protein [uncultured Stenotrophomonas sp.]